MSSIAQDSRTVTPGDFPTWNRFLGGASEKWGLADPLWSLALKDACSWLSRRRKIQLSVNITGAALERVVIGSNMLLFGGEGKKKMFEDVIRSRILR